MENNWRNCGGKLTNMLKVVLIKQFLLKKDIIPTSFLRLNLQGIQIFLSFYIKILTLLTLKIVEENWRHNMGMENN